MSPYSKLPSDQFWGTGVAAVGSDAFDPVRALPFIVAPTDPVATAGTSFAQQLGPHLRQLGYNYLQTEAPSGPQEPGYSARYGNIHTTRQLRQLMLCAYGLHRPAIRSWRRPDGRYIDPLRPQMFPAGFTTPDELAASRAAHLAAVRRVFQECSVFVFTVGSTEIWQTADGTALPVLPGLINAELPEGSATFSNLSASEMRQDLSEFIADLGAVNPKARVILTVSPVALVATFQSRHVLLANAAAKAAIRVAVEEITAAHANAAYFPAYDVITAPQHRGRFFADDLRTVTDDGMAHVMRLFTAHVLRGGAPAVLLPAAAPASADDGAVVDALRGEDARPAHEEGAPAGTIMPVASDMFPDELLGTTKPETGNLPLEIDLRTGGHGQQSLITGWSHPELEYSWTVGKSSVIRLAAGNATCDCSLKFRAGPMVVLGKRNFQRLYVDVNGVNVAKLVGRQPAQFDVLVPASALAGKSTAEIVFRMPDAASPQHLGLSPDDRELGFWFASLRLEPLLAGPMFESAAPTEPADIAPTPLADLKTIMMDLQSLGTNCELGFVQRSHGAEPLGLFRWGNTPLPNLLRALEARFDGLGDPENTVITLDAASEFQVVDMKFGLRNHSFAFQNQGATEEKIRERELVRLPFLARLLIEDLEQGDKLFCFHDAGHSSLDDIHRLVETIEKYGPSWLLWVCPANTTAQVGTAELIHQGLIRGYIDTFRPLHEAANPSLEAWTNAVTAAHGVWRAAVM